jgi:hypothetical protein
MADKVPTPGMPDKDSTAPKGDGAVDGLIPADTRGAGGGGPVGPREQSDGFHGGQSGAAYHGHGQLGEKKVEGDDNDNDNGVSRDP